MLTIWIEDVRAETITGTRELDEILTFLINNYSLDFIENIEQGLGSVFCEHFNQGSTSICRRGAITGTYLAGRDLTLAEGICLAVNGHRPSVCRRGAITNSYSIGRDLTLAEGVCLAANGHRPSVCRRGAITSAYSVGRDLTLAEGICLAGNGHRPSVCRRGAIGSAISIGRDLTLAEGICLAGNGDRPSVCRNRTYSSQEFTIEDALISLPSDDSSWAWDSFRDQYGNLVWACRGMQTGQFSFLVRCRDRPRHDLTWPG